MFLWRLLLLPLSNIYKTVLIRRLLGHVENFNAKACGPIKNALDTCVKYNLQHFVLDAIENAKYCSMLTWKKMINCIIKNKQVRRWNVTQPLFKSLLYMKSNSWQISPWWCYAHNCTGKVWQSRLIIQLLLNKDRHQHSLCSGCGTHGMLTTHHILFECTGYNHVRQSLWSKFEQVCPPNLIVQINSMSSKERCAFILNGFYCNYVSEWQELYIHLAHFIHAMYMQYTEVSDVHQ